MKTILLSFADDEVRDEFLALLKVYADATIASDDVSEGYEQRKANGELLLGALNAITLDPPIKEDHERTTSIWIAGQKLHEGPMSEMNKVFEQELASHSGSVIMKELRGGEWVEIRARRMQPQA